MSTALGSPNTGFPQCGSTLSTHGASHFSKHTTYRAHNSLDPIYQGGSYIPSPAQYRCSLEGGRSSAGANFGIALKGPFVIGKSILSGSKNSPAIGFGSSTRFKKKEEKRPGPSDYDTDNESIGNRCRTSLRDCSSFKKSLAQFRGRNNTPEINEKAAACFKIVSEDPRFGSCVPGNRNPNSLCQKIYEVDENEKGVYKQRTKFTVNFESIESLNSDLPASARNKNATNFFDNK